jgi:hypothetical protein
MILTDHLAAPLTIAGLTSVTSLVGQLTNSTTITIGEALTVFVFVASLVVWLARKLQKIEDDVERATDELEQLKEHVSSRPCQNGNCALPPKKTE